MAEAIQGAPSKQGGWEDVVDLVESQGTTLKSLPPQRLIVAGDVELVGPPPGLLRPESRPLRGPGALLVQHPGVPVLFAGEFAPIGASRPTLLGHTSFVGHIVWLAQKPATAVFARTLLDPAYAITMAVGVVGREWYIASRCPLGNIVWRKSENDTSLRAALREVQAGRQP